MMVVTLVDTKVEMSVHLTADRLVAKLAVWTVAHWGGLKVAPMADLMVF